MAQPHWEVADIFRDHGPAWRHDRALSLASLKTMSAIERCRSAELGGHVLRCEQCDEVQVAYNSCRNRHCPKCQSSAAKRWLEDRQADLLPVEYYHLVFTLPASIGYIAYQNPALVYDLLFKVTAQTLRMIAADPKHLGVKVGMTAVLHTWGSALSHHPHLHCIVPGGGLAPDDQWKPCKSGFFLPVRVLSRLFRRLFLEQLTALHPQLAFYGEIKHLTGAQAFRAYLDPVRKIEWVVYARRPFSGPKAVLEYLSRYTHRIAISNSRIIDYDQHTVTFKWKDYRLKGKQRFKNMTLSVDEFIRRFLMHVLPARFHRIRHFGLLANHQRKQNLQLIRQCLGEDKTTEAVQETSLTREQESKSPAFVCRTCGTPLIIIDILSQTPRGPPN
jgi:hypothetical protein